MSTNTRLHINHIGSRSAVDLIRTAKEREASVTCDVTPFHFFFTDSEIANYDPNFKFYPPIGNQEDVQAIREGLRDGTIDTIASDHIPWTPEEKNVEFDQAPFGAVGLETLFAMSFTTLVLSGILTIDELLRKLTVNPARILKVPLGRLEEGAEADISILDTKATWVVEPEHFESLSSNTPMKETLRGKPHATIVKGQVVMMEGKIQEGVYPSK